MIHNRFVSENAPPLSTLSAAFLSERRHMHKRHSGRLVTEYPAAGGVPHPQFTSEGKEVGSGAKRQRTHRPERQSHRRLTRARCTSWSVQQPAASSPPTAAGASRGISRENHSQESDPRVLVPSATCGTADVGTRAHCSKCISGHPPCLICSVVASAHAMQRPRKTLRTLRRFALLFAGRRYEKCQCGPQVIGMS